MLWCVRKHLCIQSISTSTQYFEISDLFKKVVWDHGRLYGGRNYMTLFETTASAPDSAQARLARGCFDIMRVLYVHAQGFSREIGAWSWIQSQSRGFNYMLQYVQQHLQIIQIHMPITQSNSNCCGSNCLCDVTLLMKVYIMFTNLHSTVDSLWIYNKLWLVHSPRIYTFSSINLLYENNHR